MRIITAAWDAVKTAVWISLSLIYAAIRCTVTGGKEEITF